MSEKLVILPHNLKYHALALILCSDHSRFGEYLAGEGTAKGYGEEAEAGEDEEKEGAGLP